MTSATRETWDKTSAIFGAIAWVVLAWLAATGRAPLGVIELLFLFAPLVIVPLALALGGAVAPSAFPRLEDAARVLQPFAAALLVASFWMSPGPRTAACAGAWVVVCCLVALSGLLNCVFGGFASLSALAVNMGRMDLAIASAWLLVSRLGARPMNFQEPVVLLTAVHFHYTGFATALLAGTVGAYVRRVGRDSRLVTAVVGAVAFLPFLLAAGFVFSSTIKLIAAVALSLSVMLLAGLQLSLIRSLQRRVAAAFLAVSAMAVFAGMTLASIYAVGEFCQKDWLLVPRMASTHGLLNALGFVVLGLLGWLIEWSN